jgi:hypothetical protein
MRSVPPAGIGERHAYLLELVSAARMVEVKMSEDDLKRLVWVRTQSAGGQVGGQREEPHTSVNQQVAKIDEKSVKEGAHIVPMKIDTSDV